MSICRDIHDAIVNLVMQDGVRDPSVKLITIEMYGDKYNRALENTVYANLGRSLPMVRETLGEHVVPLNDRYYKYQKDGVSFNSEHVVRSCIAGISGPRLRTAGIYVPIGGLDPFLRAKMRHTWGWAAGCTEHTLDTTTDAIEMGGMSVRSAQSIAKKAARTIRVKSLEGAQAAVAGVDMKALNASPSDRAPLRFLKEIQAIYEDVDGVAFLDEIALALTRRNRKHVSPAKVARVLGKFMVAPRVLSRGSREGRGYDVDTLRRVWTKFSS